MKYFTYSEFDSPDSPRSGLKMNKYFLKVLDEARDIAGIPFKISSGYRTKKHNKAVGGVEGSSHTLGLAVDIHCNNSISRMIIIKAALEAGITRIGIASNFIHLDVDEDKPQNVIWTY